MSVFRVVMNQLSPEIQTYLIENRQKIFDSDRVDWSCNVQANTVTFCIFVRQPARLSVSGEYIAPSVTLDDNHPKEQ
jgi:hypothetical protein